MERVIVVDFAGTLIHTKTLDEANQIRSDILQRSLPSVNEHADSEKLYANNRQSVEALTGLTEDHNILYTYVTGRQTTLSGEEVQNQIATTLFQIGMYQAADTHKEQIFVGGMIDTLRELRARGYSLAIMSGVRTDIISGMLEITGIDIFDYVLGQPPQLGLRNEELLKALSEDAKILYVIGDKMTDIEPAKEFSAEAVFVDWGHAQGGESDVADHTISTPAQLLDIIE